MPIYSSTHGVTYYTGRVAPPNLAQLIHASQQRFGAKLQRLRHLLGPLPAAWDSRKNGWVGAIKDQQSCGSCWDFSGTGTVEIAFNLAGVGGGPDKLILSEQYTLDCGRNGGCGGDDNSTVLEWAKQTGLPLSADYGSYHASRGRCNSGVTLHKIDDWGYASSSGGHGVTDTNDIKAAIMAHGCVGAAIAADGAFSNVSGDTVFDRTTSHSIDHDIILVGWDDSKGSKGAWLLRNSWNTRWGMDGYCWIGYGVNLVGTDANWAFVKPVVPPVIDWSKI